MSFGKRIKLTRKEFCLTQQELADLCGVGRLTITKIENNTQLPSIFLAKSIFEALNMKKELDKIISLFF